MARWIQNINSNDFDVVGDTLIAGWWPFTFHRVMTWKVKLTLSPQNSFVTIVQKTDRNGFAKSEDAVFEATYSDKAAASWSHERIVAAVAKGKLSHAYLVSCTRLIG